MDSAFARNRCGRSAALGCARGGAKSPPPTSNRLPAAGTASAPLCPRSYEELVARLTEELNRFQKERATDTNALLRDLALVQVGPNAGRLWAGVCEIGGGRPLAWGCVVKVRSSIHPTASAARSSASGPRPLLAPAPPPRPPSPPTAPRAGARCCQSCRRFRGRAVPADAGVEKSTCLQERARPCSTCKSLGKPVPANASQAQPQAWPRP
jgi:hypothetical protein